MIIKIDHVSLSCTDLPRATQDLLRLGYQKQFEERNIRNLSIKKPLLNAWVEKHDLALFSCKNNISIELLNHRSMRDGAPSFFMPVVRGADWVTKSKNTVIIGNQQGVLATIGNFACIALDGERKTFTLQGLAVRTRDLDESESFWNYFGFRRMLAGNDYRVLEFVSPLQANPYTMYLLQSADPIRETKLDDAGFTSIGFVCNDVHAEREALHKKNIQATTIEELTIHNKILHICFVKGPQGEIVELLSPKTHEQL